MRKVESNANTEYYAIKRGILKSIEFFINNPNDFFVKIVSNWTDYETGKENKTSVGARREIISQFVGFDFVKHKTLFIETQLGPRTKEEYLHLWKCLKSNEKYIKPILK